MDRIDFFCCRHRDWARLTGYFEIGYFTFNFVLTMSVVQKLISMGSAGFRTSRFTASMFNEIPGDETDYAVAVILGIVVLFVLAGRVAMGLVLLQGIQKKISRYLNWWIVYANVAIGWNIVVIAVGAYASSAVVVKCLLLCCFYALGIWSVRLELEELWDGQDIREEVVEMQPPPAVLADVNPPSYEEVISKNP